MNVLRPAELWRKDGTASSRIHDVVASELFHRAVIFALAEYAKEVGTSPDAGAKLLGANDILHKLLNLGSEPERRTVPSFSLPVEEKP